MMSVTKDLSEMYDALLSLDALDDQVKLDIRVPCRITLLLALAVEQGLAFNDPTNFFKKVVSEEDQKRLSELTEEILKKGKMERFYQKLKGLK